MNMEGKRAYIATNGKLAGVGIRLESVCGGGLW
jgi:hypothetical protein